MHYNIDSENTSHNEVCTCAMIKKAEEGRLGLLKSMNWQQRQSREHSWQCVLQRVTQERQQRYKDVRNLKKRHERFIKREVSKEIEEKRLQHDYILDQ